MDDARKEAWKVAFDKRPRLEFHSRGGHLGNPLYAIACWEVEVVPFWKGRRWVGSMGTRARANASGGAGCTAAKEKGEVMSTLRPYCIVLAVALLTGLVGSDVLLAQESALYAGAERCEIPFAGQASGGTLVLCDTLNRNARAISIETARDEPASLIAARLAQAINQTDPFDWRNPPGTVIVTARQGTLRTLPGSGSGYMIAGTETGLDIPPPPSSLTCNVAADGQSVALRWRNPPGGYDCIRIVLNWCNYLYRGGTEAPGTSEESVVDVANMLEIMAALGLSKQCNVIDDLDVWVIGVRKGVPSNASAMHINGNVQEELFGIPFFRDVAPNWNAWRGKSATDGVMRSQATRQERTAARGRHNAIRAPGSKPFYQLLQSTRADASGGVYRTFIGLTPRHTYRVRVRVNTLALTRDSGEWAVSVHAVHNAPSVELLSTDQMRGASALPDGTQGLDAARLVKYDKQTTTGGAWASLSTGNDAPSDALGDIALPDDVDSLTVWVRCQGEMPGPIGVDWLSIEDLSATSR